MTASTSSPDGADASSPRHDARASDARRSATGADAPAGPVGADASGPTPGEERSSAGAASGQLPWRTSRDVYTTPAPVPTDAKHTTYTATAGNAGQYYAGGHAAAPPPSLLDTLATPAAAGTSAVPWRASLDNVAGGRDSWPHLASSLGSLAHTAGRAPAALSSGGAGSGGSHSHYHHSSGGNHSHYSGASGGGSSAPRAGGGGGATSELISSLLARYTEAQSFLSSLHRK
jgi:hypothetical protein